MSSGGARKKKCLVKHGRNMVLGSVLQEAMRGNVGLRGERVGRQREEPGALVTAEEATGVCERRGRVNSLLRAGRQHSSAGKMFLKFAALFHKYSLVPSKVNTTIKKIKIVLYYYNTIEFHIIGKIIHVFLWLYPLKIKYLKKSLKSLKKSWFIKKFNCMQISKLLFKDNYFCLQITCLCFTEGNKLLLQPLMNFQMFIIHR
ncbi:Protein of unknown function [Gryllus bimaculatus]|nr:Protein of unknown function [Gryllus bimaculatus]